MLRLRHHLTILSYWAPPMIGGPQNLYNLFSQIDTKDYSIVTSLHNIRHHTKVESGTPLACQYLYYDQKSPILSPTYGMERKNIINVLLKIPYIGRSLKFYLSFFEIIRNFTLSGIKVSKRNPGVIMGVSDGGPTLISTFLVAKITRQPYVIYLFDLYRDNYLQGIYKYIARFFEYFLLRQAKIVFVTNEKTKHFYQNRYDNKINVEVVHNSALINRHVISNKSTSNIQHNIVFTGNVGWPQEQSLLNVISAVKLLNDIPVKLALYIPAPTIKIVDAVKNCTRISLTHASHKEMGDIQGNASLLVLPLSWNTDAPEIISTASPGKYTDYMGSGQPMLVHAPDYAFVSQCTRKYNLGLVVDQNNINVLAKTIREFLADPTIGQTYVENSLRYFHQNLDACSNATKLTELLNTID